jgi:acyl-homoserine lactone acylase PvdQ
MATLAVVLATLVAPSGAAADRAYNILPPGQWGGTPFTDNSRDQLALYDALTPKLGNVTATDLRELFKQEALVPTGSTTRESTPRRGLTIRRDRFGVPHITGRTRADVWFGVGWVSARDRQLLLTIARGPARAAVAEVPGLNAFGLVTGGRAFTPSAQAEALVTRQQRLFARVHGAKGRQILRDLRSYTAGVNAYWSTLDSPPARWTVNDSIAATAFIGSIFGNGGGAEAQNAAFLAALRQRLGRERGDRAFLDLMAADDPEHATTLRRRFPFGRASAQATPGSPVVDAGSLQLVPDPTRRTEASNFLVVGDARSRPRASLAVMGPQLGYFYPEIVLEANLRGPGIRARGAVAPGSPYVLIGRTQDYAWSLTTAQNDNRDAFLEQLCGERRYRYRGRCVSMRRFDAGELAGAGGAPSQRLVFDMTVHGPVIGRATVGGRAYAVTRARSTYGRDALSLAALRDMTLGRGRTVDGFYRSVNQFEFTFNWAYASRKATAFFTSGRLPKRPRGLDRRLPTLGTGKYDWNGFLSERQHPHDVGGPGGLLLNWNNRSAPGFMHGDDEPYGSVQRVELFNKWPKRPRIADVVSVMNRAATEDVRSPVWPVVSKVLHGGPAPNARAAQLVSILDAWVRRDAPRLDADNDGKYDEPGPAIMDAAWRTIANAVMRPVLGDTLLEAVNDVRGLGSLSGESYVDKDLRTLLGRHVAGKFNVRYCGKGSLSSCRASLWTAIDQTAATLAAELGPDPTAWLTTAARTSFVPGLLPNTMRATNRPTFQQVLEFQNR